MPGFLQERSNNSFLELTRKAASGIGFLEQHGKEGFQQSTHILGRHRIQLPHLVWYCADELVDFISGYISPLHHGRRGPVWHIVRGVAAVDARTASTLLLKNAAKSSTVCTSLSAGGASPSTSLNVRHSLPESPLLAAISSR